VREEQRIAGHQVRGDLLDVQLPLHLVGGEDHHQIGLRDGLRDGKHPQALGLRLRRRGAAGAQADAHVDAGVAQAERVGVTLRAVADDGDAAVLDDRQVGVGVVEHFCHGVSNLLVGV